jgi:hypothetical protein
MLQPGRERFDLQSLRNRRRFSLLPAEDLGDMHGRQQILLQIGQDGVGADLGVRIAASVTAAGKAQERTAQQGRANET